MTIDELASAVAAAAHTLPHNYAPSGHVMELIAAPQNRMNQMLLGASPTAAAMRQDLVFCAAAILRALERAQDWKEREYESAPAPARPADVATLCGACGRDLMACICGKQVAVKMLEPVKSGWGQLKANAQQTGVDGSIHYFIERASLGYAFSLCEQYSAKPAQIVPLPVNKIRNTRRCVMCQPTNQPQRPFGGA